MPGGEIVGIVTGVVGAVTAIVTVAPHILGAFEKCTKYFERWTEHIKGNEEKYAALLQMQKQILQAIIQILNKGESQVDDRTHLIDEAEKAIEIIRRSRSIDPWDCFGFCSCLTDLRKSCLVAEYVSDVEKRTNILRKELRKRAIDIKKLEKLERNSIHLVGEQGNEVIREIRWKILLDDIDSEKIGVYGACGVGKTEVVRRAFDSIRTTIGDSITFIWLELSYENDLLKLQMEIGKQIGRKLPTDGSVQDNAKELNNGLRKKKNILLVLDNMRKVFSLDEIGLPTIKWTIITSRSFLVCCQMHCNVKFALKSLSDDEAYELLEYEIFKPSTHTIEEYQSTLKKIAKKCGGLPLAIVAAAKWLRKYFEYDDLVLTERSLKMESAAFSILP
ncbi:Disease resistance protein [Melia azedarach]|uniref:Disease resistance protein n=1 Tax=Melia azedarach TaxID=155640 RepID=A0ACC1Y6C1_MELAZ|nr:Disease resistance protein [Melia azedarach]